MLNPRAVKTIEDAKNIINERNLTHVKVGVFDVDGIFRGKYMSKEKFLSSLDNGFAFCDVVLGWDSKDQLYDNVAYTGWHTAYPDAPVRVVPESCREIPFENNALIFIGEFKDEAAKICPRNVLKRVIKRARELGLIRLQRLSMSSLCSKKRHRVYERKIIQILQRGRQVGLAIRFCVIQYTRIS